MNTFVILSGVSFADVKDLVLTETSWTDKAGAKHTVGAIKMGDNLVRQTKDGRMLIEKAPKQPRKR